MRFPFPFGDWKEWAYDLILALEAPKPAEDEYNRQQSTKIISSGMSPYEVSRFDYVIEVDTSISDMTVILPASKADGWECEIVKTKPQNRLIILPSGADTLIGEVQVDVYDQWTALKFRAVIGGFIIV